MHCYVRGHVVHVLGGLHVWGVLGWGQQQEVRKDAALIVIENHFPLLWHTWAGRKPKPFCLLRGNQWRESGELPIVSVEDEISSLFFQLRLSVAIVGIWVQTERGHLSATLCTVCLQGKEGLGSRRPWWGWVPPGVTFSPVDLERVKWPSRVESRQQR